MRPYGEFENLCAINRGTGSYATMKWEACSAHNETQWEWELIEEGPRGHVGRIKAKHVQNDPE